MMCCKNKEELKALIPLYVKGCLQEKEKKTVEEAIKKDPELRKELEDWTLIDRAYKELEKKIPAPPPNLYEQIRDRIEEKSLLKTLFHQKWMRIVEAGVILIQFLIIIFLNLKLYHSPVYYTLSQPELSKKKVKINVIFKENAPEGKIRSLLLSQKAKIVDGPYPSGLYVIAVDSEKASYALKIFKENSLVVMAEKSY